MQAHPLNPQEESIGLKDMRMIKYACVEKLPISPMCHFDKNPDSATLPTQIFTKVNELIYNFLSMSTYLFNCNSGFIVQMKSLSARPPLLLSYALPRRVVKAD